MNTYKKELLESLLNELTKYSYGPGHDFIIQLEKGLNRLSDLNLIRLTLVLKDITSQII